MKIVRHAAIEEVGLPGITHRTVAGPRDGATSMEVWMQTLAPGATTPVHRHDCEEIVVILRGSGTCEAEGEGEPRAFGPGSTLILGPNEVHRIANTGTEEMWLVAALAMAPVRVETPEGEHMPLPWEQARG
jgi:quercetin dioxygenase-like cupin family protein